jgi:hypothetical protein
VEGLALTVSLIGELARGLSFGGVIEPFGICDRLATLSANRVSISGIKLSQVHWFSLSYSSIGAL